MNFIFIHGWGMDSNVWGEMSEYFPKEQCHFVNLGFIGEEKITVPNNKNNIFITHSLGTMWALKYHADNMAGLVAINGFTNFKHFTPERTLLTMQKHLQRNHLRQMHDFWKMCDIDIYNNAENLNIDRLHEGLKWLINWDMGKEFSDLNIPTLSLIGDKDPLLPTVKMEKEWQKADIKIAENGGHILPLSHPKWCIDKIKDFNRGFELER